jgi:hypothetical protein
MKKFLEKWATGPAATEKSEDNSKPHKDEPEWLPGRPAVWISQGVDHPVLVENLCAQRTEDERCLAATFQVDYSTEQSIARIGKRGLLPADQIDFNPPWAWWKDPELKYEKANEDQGFDTGTAEVAFCDTTPPHLTQDVYEEDLPDTRSKVGICPGCNSAAVRRTHCDQCGEFIR